MMKHTY